MEFRRGKGMRLDLDQTAKSPGPYTTSFGFKLDVLCESIRKVGLINPPLVARNPEGAFDIVAGYRRILALRALGERETFGYDVTASLASPLERLLAGFYENLATRGFNDIEKAIVLNKLGNYVTTEEILVSFMPLLSLPSHEGTLNFYLKLLDLEENVQRSIGREEISIKVAKALVEMGKGERQALLHWIDLLRINFNQQIKFIEYVQDIGLKEMTTIPKILSEGSFVEIVENPRLNTPQKAKLVLEMLRVRLSPRLAQAQQAVESAVSAISMPREASIHYDPYLEHPCYRLDISFKHGKDLKRTISKLHALRELEAIPELWAGQ